MEASALATPPADAPVAYDGAAEATRSTVELFEWSGYVHVGGDADACEHRLDGACSDARHFHSWVCLPNPFQIRDIADKARAAKARKARALRDPESDSGVTLESELMELRDETQLEYLVKLLAQRAVESKLMELVEEMNRDQRFEHHAQDAEEFRRQQEVDEGERDAEEFAGLQADMLAYGDALQQLVDARTTREEASLRSLSVDQVIDLERKARIANIADETYLHTYYTWAMYVGARVPTTTGFPSVRSFLTPEALKSAAPEVVGAIREKIRELEGRTTRRGEAAGN